jgi:hypothetical protein
MHGPDNDHTPFDNKMAALRNAVKDYKESPEGKKQIYSVRRAIEKRVKAVAVCYFSFAPLTFTILYPTAAMVIGAGVAAYAVRDVYKFGSQNFLNKAWKSVKSSWKQVGSDALFLAKLPFKAIGYIFSKDEPSQHHACVCQCDARTAGRSGWHGFHPKAAQYFRRFRTARCGGQFQCPRA